MNSKVMALAIVAVVALGGCSRANDDRATHATTAAPRSSDNTMAPRDQNGMNTPAPPPSQTAPPPADTGGDMNSDTDTTAPNSSGTSNSTP